MKFCILEAPGIMQFSPFSNLPIQGTMPVFVSLKINLAVAKPCSLKFGELKTNLVILDKD